MTRKLFTVVVFLLGTITVAFAQKVEIVNVDYMESSARYLEPTQSIMTTPLIADLSVVGGQISYTEVEAFKNYEVTENTKYDAPGFKKIALCNAARAHKADMIIGAMIDVVTNDEGRLEITVIGYPARYTNFRNATVQDIDLVVKGMTVLFDSKNDILETPEEDIIMEEGVRENKKVKK